MSRGGGIDAAARLGAVGLEIHLTAAQHPEALAKRRAHLRRQAEAGGHGRVESGAHARRRRARAGAQGGARRQAPVGALEQDLGP